MTSLLLSKPQATVLALWSFGMVLARACALTAVSLPSPQAQRSVRTSRTREGPRAASVPQARRKTQRRTGQRRAGWPWSRARRWRRVARWRAGAGQWQARRRQENGACGALQW